MVVLEFPGSVRPFQGSCLREDINYDCGFGGDVIQIMVRGNGTEGALCSLAYWKFCRKLLAFWAAKASKKLLVSNVPGLFCRIHPSRVIFLSLPSTSHLSFSGCSYLDRMYILYPPTILSVSVNWPVIASGKSMAKASAGIVSITTSRPASCSRLQQGL